MIEKLNYISDAELEQLMAQVEQEELLTAPPDMEEKILAAVGLDGGAEKPQLSKVLETKTVVTRKKEFYAYCFRVVTSVAAAVALVFLLPQMTAWMGEEVAKPVPDKATVIATEGIPTKEEVLNDTGMVERIIRSTGWFNKESTDN